MYKKFSVNFILIIFPVLIIILGIFVLSRGQNTMKTIKIKNQQFEINIVKTQADIEKGLSGRENMAENEGMLFEFSDLDFRTFWMKNMNFPIDIIFIDENYKICDIKENFQSCQSINCPNYISKCNAQYVLETNTGFAKLNKIQINELVELNIK